MSGRQAWKRARQAVGRQYASVMRPSCGKPLLRDIQVGHHLDARDEGSVQGTLGFDHVAQAAVDAKTYHRARFEGFDVDIRRTFAQRLGQQRIDQPDDGRVVLRLQQVFDRRQILRQPAQIKIGRYIVGHVGRLTIMTREHLGNSRLERLGAERFYPYRSAQHPTQLHQTVEIISGTHQYIDLTIDLANVHRTPRTGECIA